MERRGINSIGQELFKTSVTAAFGEEEYIFQAGNNLSCISLYDGSR